MSVIATVTSNAAAVLADAQGLGITGLGSVTHEHVMALDTARQLTWVSEDARAWFYTVAASTPIVRPEASAGDPAGAGPDRLLTPEKPVPNGRRVRSVSVSVAILLLVAVAAYSLFSFIANQPYEGKEIMATVVKIDNGTANTPNDYVALCDDGHGAQWALIGDKSGFQDLQGRTQSLKVGDEVNLKLTESSAAELQVWLGAHPNGELPPADYVAPKEYVADLMGPPVP
jgi:hypothetical protein